MRRSSSDTARMGSTWEKLNKDASGTAQPILTNDAEGSDLGVRDPHVIRSAEGDKYWILGTDLHAEGGGAGGSGREPVERQPEPGGMGI